MVKKGLTFLLILTALISYSQKVSSSAYSIMLETLLSHSVDEITVKEAKQLQNVVFLDARERKEYTISHIKNAIWIGYDTFNLQSLSKTPKNKTIIVYCSVGYRSEKISEQLLKNGYTSVKNLYGGIFEWANEGLPVYNQKGPTKAVHAYDRTWGIWLLKGEKIY